MRLYYDCHGQQVRLGRQLGSGGEGDVFEVGNDGKHVAKIYHQAVTPDKAHKLECMAKQASSQLTQIAAWPLSTLHAECGGQLVGITMPRVKNHTEIHNLYSPAHRRQFFPDKDWQFLVHSAMNCAAAFDAIHSRSFVVGDVNQGNVLVAAQGTVVFIDCDSFQIQASGRFFPCEVGVAHFTPPELQARPSFRGIVRSANHDRFGLAVLIFHLLFMGRHPFAGRFLGRGDMPIERAIREFRFAFGRHASALQMAPPPDALLLDKIPPDLAALFERAFGRNSELDGARPTAREWYASLTGLNSALRTCSMEPGHKYYSRLSHCPWCEIEQRGGINFFLCVAVGNVADVYYLSVDVDQLWRDIEAVSAPRSSPAPPPLPNIGRIVPTPLPFAWNAGGRFGPNVGRIVPTPLPTGVDAARQMSRLVRGITVGSLVLSTIAMIEPRIAYITIPIFVVFAIWWSILSIFSVESKENNRRKRALRNSRTQLNALRSQREALSTECGAQFLKTRERLVDVCDLVGRLKPAYDEEVRRLERDKERRQRDLFLQNVFICDHSIDQIGPSRAAVLQSYNIETAYDIRRESIQQIRGFGPALIEVLLAWRRGMESQFRFDPRKEIPVADRQALVLKYLQKQQFLKSALQRGPLELREVVEKCNRSVAALSVQISQAEICVARAEADIAVLK